MERTWEEIATEVSPDEIERLWLDEAVRRYQQLRDGTARSTPSDEVFARAQARQR
jgi:hypothetical protein